MPSDLSFLTIFLAGLATTLTPCVYPMIPITLAVIGIEQVKPFRVRLKISTAYVLGLITCYLAIGIVTGLSGAIFGSYLGNPIVKLLICLITFSMGLYCLEFFEIKFFSKLQNYAGKISAGGITGVFLAGLLSAFIAAPCVGPVLSLIITKAAFSKSIASSIFQLLTYGIGLGLPFFFLGLFASSKFLPRAGRWLNGVKYLMAVGLFLASAKFLPYPELLPDLVLQSQAILVGFLSLIIGVFLMLRDRKIVALFFAILTTISFSRPFTANNSEINWRSDFKIGLQEAQKKTLPMMVDVRADWCSACIELEELTFPEPRVKSALSKIVTVRLDFTNFDETASDFTKEHDIPGLPAIMLFTPDGEERKDLRISGFVPPDELLARLELLEK